MDLEALKIAVYRRLPAVLQLQAIRRGTPNFSLGSMCLLTDDGSRLLLVRPTYRNGWLPPGGFLGRAEEPADALQRELEEELGLQMTVAAPHRVFLDVHRQTVTFVSVGVLPAGQQPRLCGPELSDLRWFALDALPPFPADFHEGVTDEDLAVVRAVGSGPG